MAIVRPSAGPISSQGSFGWRKLSAEPSFHSGIDFLGGYGSPVRAVKNGVVHTAAPNGTYSRYGNLVVIKHDDATEAPLSLYAHMDRFVVKRGERVKAGQTIGYMGNSSAMAQDPNRTVRTHLHFELLKAFPSRPDVGRIDPTPFLSDTFTPVPSPPQGQGPILYTDYSYGQGPLRGFSGMTMEAPASWAPPPRCGCSYSLSELAGAGLPTHPSRVRNSLEESMSFESTKWTSTNPAPFAPAPGAGYEGLSLLNAIPDISYITFDDTQVVTKGIYVVRKKPVAPGGIPATFVQMYLTDRGAINQAQLDQAVFTPIRNKGFVMNVGGSEFKPLPVTWQFQKFKNTNFYEAVVVTPTYLKGLSYGGSAISALERSDPSFSPSAANLSRLPKQIWVYSFAVTNPNLTMTDADNAQLLTLIKAGVPDAWDKAGAAGWVYLTSLGADPSTFDLPVPPPPPPPPPEKDSGLLWWLVAAAALAYSQMG